ncbi:MAG: hypothetical protein WKF75_08585 [Singulisphaera sp.]
MDSACRHDGRGPGAVCCSSACSGWPGWRRVRRGRRFDERLATAHRALARERHGEACAHPRPAGQRWPGHAEVEFSLGVCERAVGTSRPRWRRSRVPAGSAQASLAALRRTELLFDLGRWAEAEAILEPLARNRGRAPMMPGGGWLGSTSGKFGSTRPERSCRI